MDGETIKSEPTQIASSQVLMANASAPMRLIEMAITQDLGIEKLERLMSLQNQWEEKEARKAYFMAMSAFQSQCPTIKKTKLASFPTKNGEMSYYYASLDDICEQIKPFLEKNGLSFRFEQSMDNNCISIICIATHSAGHSERCLMQGFPDTSGNKNNIQQVASTVTYLRRYALEGVFGIATAAQDIDGRLPQPEKKEEDTGDFNFYSNEDFVINYKKWKKSVSAGKVTPASIISRVQTKFTLSDEQLAQINTLEKAQ